MILTLFAVALFVSLCPLGSTIGLDLNGKIVVNVDSQRFELSARHLGVREMVRVIDFPHIWRATGWCPPGNKSSSAIREYALSESSWQNHAFIRASDGIDLVRIHDLLFLLEVEGVKADIEVKNIHVSPSSSSSLDSKNVDKKKGSRRFDASLLDEVLDMVVLEHNLTLGFELMGNPGGDMFTSWKDPAQIETWRLMVSFLASRYVERYGSDTVRQWRWEGWNEPDHVCNSDRDMDAGIACDLDSWLSYLFDACAIGLRDVDPSLVFGGPGTGGATLTTPFLANMLTRAEQVRDDRKRRLDFVQWHKKGVLPTSSPSKPSSTAFDCDVCEEVRRVAPSLDLPAGNEEVDPEGDWSRPYTWRGDATYPAAIVRSLDMHLHDIVDNASLAPLLWGYHANDNAFLNYGDQWFSQRTLTARFMMNTSRSRDNDTVVVEVVRKPVLNLMKVLSFLGTERLPSSSVVSSVVGVPGYGANPTRNPVGIIATTRGTSNERWERSVLLYGSDGVEVCNSTTCRMVLRLELTGLPTSNASTSAAALAHYVIDQDNGNPMGIWDAMGGANNPYPSAEQFVRLREASELVVSSRHVLDPIASSVSRTFNFSRPSVHLFHICGGSRRDEDASSRLAIRNVSLRVTPTLHPPTVLVRWSAIVERCVSTYQVFWRENARGVPSKRVNTVDTVHRIFVHAQPDRNASGVSKASGCYAVLAVDYWGVLGPISGEVCV